MYVLDHSNWHDKSHWLVYQVPTETTGEGKKPGKKQPRSAAHGHGHRAAVSHSSSNIYIVSSLSCCCVLIKVEDFGFVSLC